MLLELSNVDWPRVKDYPLFGRYEAEVTVDSQTSILTIPALKAESMFALDKMLDEHFDRTNSPLVAFRFGDRGMYYVRLNPRAFVVNKMTHTIGKHFDLMRGDVPEQVINEAEYYKGYLLNGAGDSLRIQGVLIDSNKQVSILFRYTNRHLSRTHISH